MNAVPDAVYPMTMNVRLDGAGEVRRRELAQFLRTRRQRLSPSEARLPWSGGRRRTPGLRREEVALMANVSVSWYTSLEQGRDVGPSAAILEGIARALQLSAPETRHLFVLAGQTPPPGTAPSPQTPSGTVSPTLRRVMDDLGTSPAWAMTAREDLAYWNSAADAAFLLSSPIPSPHERNLMWRMFLDPALRELYEDWETVAQAGLARFRADFTLNPGDPGFEELVEDLKRESAEFREWWPRHDVMEESDGRKRFVHPEVGRLTLEHTTLHSPADPDLRVLVYVPSTDEDQERLEEIMAKADGSTSRTGSKEDMDGQGSSLA